MNDNDDDTDDNNDNGDAMMLMMIAMTMATLIMTRRGSGWAVAPGTPKVAGIWKAIDFSTNSDPAHVQVRPLSRSPSP